VYVDFLLAEHEVIDSTTQCNNVNRYSLKVIIRKVGRWFSPGTPTSSTTKTGRYDIAEILLKVALNPINNQSIYGFYLPLWYLQAFLMATSFSGGRSRCTRGEPPTDFITCRCESSAPFL
jgi:hypothetical protein